ncbi:cell wall-binding repeat-containing protein [Agreia sp. COWG]|uniref:cell wall-binding repeat-containing protein n=1 Tax=Agreia sp. COWG TaxID=2773266 RepID=UPI0019251DF6|nr:cell wall-binding repeat-containing protein [Agreia sp. COWG]
MTTVAGVVLPAGASNADTLDPTDSPPVVMGVYPPEEFAPEASTLDPGLVDAIQRDLGQSGEQYLASAAAASDASYVIEDLGDEGHPILGSQLNGTQLTVFVGSGDTDTAAAAQQAGATVAYGSPPALDIDTTSVVPLADLYDGQGWGYQNSGGGAACSVGFVGTGPSAARQFVTAGHCFPPGTAITGQAFALNQSAAGAPLSRGADLGLPIASSFQFGGGSDSGLVSVNSSWTLKPQALTWGNGTGAALATAPIAVTDSRAAVTGASLCKSGERTGWSCGTILAVDYDISVGSNTVNSIIATTCADHGDSGGAALSGSTAIGITSAGTDTSTVPCGSENYFSSYFPMVSTAGKASVNSAQRNWEPLVTVAPPVVTSPPSGASIIQGGSMTGTLAAGNATNRVTVTISGDTSGPRIAAVAAGGAWAVPLTGLPVGTYNYTATARWNTYSVSSTTSGTFTVVPRPSTSRLSGDDRYATSVAIAKASYPGSADTVYVATGENYPDALSAAPAAVAEGAPLLLVPSSSVPQSVTDEITSLRPKTVVVVGGPAAISDSVVADLSALSSGGAVRVSGNTRYETSRLISERAFGPSLTSAYVATGANFPDALSASAVAAGRGAPVILVPGAASSVDSDTTSFISSRGISSIVIAGGTAAVSSQIEAQLKTVPGVSVQRLAGQGRSQTSAAINEASFTTSSEVYLATGSTFPDALAGAALAGLKKAPLYVIPTQCLPSYVLDDIAHLGAGTVTALGGFAALAEPVDSLTSCG